MQGKSDFFRDRDHPSQADRRARPDRVISATSDAAPPDRMALGGRLERPVQPRLRSTNDTDALTTPAHTGTTTNPERPGSEARQTAMPRAPSTRPQRPGPLSPKLGAPRPPVRVPRHQRQLIGVQQRVKVAAGNLGRGVGADDGVGREQPHQPPRSSPRAAAAGWATLARAWEASLRAAAGVVRGRRRWWRTRTRSCRAARRRPARAATADRAPPAARRPPSRRARRRLRDLPRRSRPPAPHWSRSGLGSAPTGGPGTTRWSPWSARPPCCRSPSGSAPAVSRPAAPRPRPPPGRKAPASRAGAAAAARRRTPRCDRLRSMSPVGRAN